MGCGEKCQQCYLIILNIITLLIGLALLVVGIYAEVEMRKLVAGDNNEADIIYIFIIVLGALFLFLGVFGCCGACRKSLCCLKLYLIFASILFLFSIAVAITGYVKRDQAKAFLETGIKQMYSGYEKIRGYKSTIDFMQRKLKCCGVTGEWIAEWGPKPDECISFHEGCLDKLIDIVKKSMVISASVVLGFTVLLILGIATGICLHKEIVNEYE
ncbi:unnamed protein product [Calicophoron daubneyi]|uniref:Tetraspanin n=1 Tax=Calicophoron daubneyi TaxID=300641 RepID=A0AAV2TWM5_CALDB